MRHSTLSRTLLDAMVLQVQVHSVSAQPRLPSRTHPRLLPLRRARRPIERRTSNATSATSAPPTVPARATRAADAPAAVCADGVGRSEELDVPVASVYSMRTISLDASLDTRRRPCRSNSASTGRKPVGHRAPSPPWASSGSMVPLGPPPPNGSRTTAKPAGVSRFHEPCCATSASPAHSHGKAPRRPLLLLAESAVQGGAEER